MINTACLASTPGGAFQGLAHESTRSFRLVTNTMRDAYSPGRRPLPAAHITRVWVFAHLCSQSLLEGPGVSEGCSKGVFAQGSSPAWSFAPANT